MASYLSSSFTYLVPPHEIKEKWSLFYFSKLLKTPKRSSLNSLQVSYSFITNFTEYGLFIAKEALKKQSGFNLQPPLWRCEYVTTLLLQFLFKEYLSPKPSIKNSGIYILEVNLEGLGWC